MSTSVRLTRAEFEDLIEPPCRTPSRPPAGPCDRPGSTPLTWLTAIVLVGGSSRIPLVSHLLQDELGVRPALDTHPKHDIALGAVRYRPSASDGPPAATVRREPTTAEAQPGRRRSSRRRTLIGAGVATALVLGGAAAYLLLPDDGGAGPRTEPEVTVPDAGDRVLHRGLPPGADP